MKKSVVKKMCLFEEYVKKTTLSLKDDEDNFSNELNHLQVAIAEKIMDTTYELKNR